MNPFPASPSATAGTPDTRLLVERPDGSVVPVPEGEFRSTAGRLLFVHRGNGIEIRCPRSKELFRVRFSSPPPALGIPP